MAAQGNDIKQLFSHLGLNPGDYLEIRPKPVSNATVAKSQVPESWMPAPAPGAAPMPGPEPVPAPAPSPAAAPAPVAISAPAPAPVAAPAAKAPAAAAVVAALLPTPPPAAPAPVMAKAEKITTPSERDLAPTVTLHTPPRADHHPAAENLHTLFQQVKEPAGAGVPAEEEEGALDEHLADTQYVPPTPQSRRPAAEDSRGTEAIDAALARLKEVPSRLQTPQAAGQTAARAGEGKKLNDVFRRLQKGGKHA